MADFSTKTIPQLTAGGVLTASTLLPAYDSPGPMTKRTGQQLLDFVEVQGGYMKKDYSNATVNLPVAKGGTGANTAPGALTNLGAASASSVSTLSGQVSTLQTQVNGISVMGSSPYPTAAAGVSKGVFSLASLVAGSGGTNGTFAIGFSGGAGTGAAGTFVVAGGAIVSTTITARGYGYTSAPTVSFAASSGLTGASATAVIADNTTNGQTYNVTSANADIYADVYKNNAGTPQYLKTLFAGNPKPTYQFGQADYQNQTTNNAWPTNYYQVWASTLGSCTLNADGTITIPPGAVLTSENFTAAQIGMSSSGPFRAVYAVGVNMDVSSLSIQAYQGGSSNLMTNQTQDFPHMQTARLLFQNLFGGVAQTTIKLTLTNNGSGSVTIFKPEFYQADSAILPRIIRYDETASVYWPTVAPNEFWKLYGEYDFSDRRLQESLCTSAVDSVNGSDANSGSILAPKKTLGALSAWSSQKTYGLQRGSSWNEILPANLSNSYIAAVDIGRNTAPLPIISGASPVTSWTSNGDGTYSATVTLDSVPGSGLNYDQVILYQINKNTVATTPMASRSQLRPVSLAVPVVPGTVNVSFVSGTNYLIRMYPTDSAAPGTLYNYEAAVRSMPARLSGVSDTARCELSGVNTICGWDGYGSFAGAFNLTADRIVSQGGTTHAFVGVGSVTRSAFIMNGVKPSGYADIPNVANGMTFYTVNGAGGYPYAKGIMVYGCESPFYAHTSGTNFEKVSYDYCAGILDRRANGGLAPTAAFGAQNTKIASFNYTYCQNICFSQGLTDAPTLTQGAVYKNVGVNIVQGTMKNNIIVTQNQSDPGNVNNRNQTMFRFVPGATVTSSLIMASTVNPGNGLTDYGVTLYGANADRTVGIMGPARGNIYVFNNTLNNQTSMAADGCSITAANGTNPYLDSDYNVFVFVTKGAIASGSGGTKGATFQEYQTNSLQDAHSLAIILQDDPRGLKAIWQDPANGNFAPAQTPIAKQIQDFFLTAGLPFPPMPSAWPTIPTEDEAYAYVAAA